jgi:hypothetical protein
VVAYRIEQAPVLRAVLDLVEVWGVVCQGVKQSASTVLILLILGQRT